MTQEQIAEQLRSLYRLAKAKGFVTIDDLDRAFPPDEVDAQHFAGMLFLLHGMGIAIAT